MRRITALLGTLTLTVAVALPASAQVCDDLVGFATLTASGAGTAQGTGVVFWDGAVQVVSIDSAVSGSLVEQVWHFDGGDVELTETPKPVLLAGPFQIIDSDVVVHAPNSGDWTYNGLFNERTLRANFVVSGELCIG